MLRARLFSSAGLRLAFTFLAALCASACSRTFAQSLRVVPAIFAVGNIDGVPSASNNLNAPYSVATDAVGNLYVADSANHLVRKVDPTGNASIFAGTGAYGYSGDGGQATAATFSYPNFIAADPAGNIYVSDGSNYAVRKIAPNGVISTIAGGHGAGSSGNGGAATAAKIWPGGIATDALGNVFVVDATNSTVRRIGLDGNITLYAGGGTVAIASANGVAATSAALVTPRGLAVDAQGNLYIAENGTYTVRKVDTAGKITVFAGSTWGYSGDGGQATSAQMRGPNAITFDPDGNAYIADIGARNVRAVSPSGVISTLAGDGDASTQIVDGIPAIQAQLDSPTGVAADINGNVFLTVPNMNFVYRVPVHPERFPRTEVGKYSMEQRIIVQNVGSNPVQFTSISFSGDFALAAQPIYEAYSNTCAAGHTIYPGFNGFCTLDVIFTPTAEGIRSFPVTIVSNDTPNTFSYTLTSTGLGAALAITSGQMYVVAGKHGAYPDPTATGSATSVGLNQINGVAVDGSGNIFISESSFCQIRRVDGVTGELTTYGGTHPLDCNAYWYQVSGDGGQAADAYIPYPGPLAIDAANNLYVADPWDGRIRRIAPNGVITTVAGKDIGSGNTVGGGYSGDGGPAINAELYGPQGIAFDNAGNMFVADARNNVIRKIATNGTITTVAGNHALGAGFSGDGGAATSAQLNDPHGVTVDANGNIYIADTENDVVRFVSAATGNISTIAGQHGVQGYSGDGGTSVNSKLYWPMGMAIDAAGDVFVADYYNMVVRKIDPAGIITTIAGNNQVYDGYNGDGLPATATWLAFPNYLAMSSSGHLFISEYGNETVREMSPNGALIFPPTQVGTTSAPQSVTLSNIGNMPMHFDSQYPYGVTGDFALASGGNCDFTATLAVGASCSVNIDFTPTQEGSRYGVFGFFDDGVASPQFVSLSGTGTQMHPQQITLTVPPIVSYGDAPFAITASSTSGLPVTLSIIQGGSNATLSGNTITIKNSGSVTIQATQAGDSTYLPAQTVTKQFFIAPATLFVYANAEQSQTGQPIAALGYTVGQMQYSDTPAVITGTPLLTTTVTPQTLPGTYSIQINANYMHAANYTIIGQPGFYYVTAPPPVKQTIIVTAAASYGKVPDGGYICYVTIKNSGNTAAPAVVLQSVKLGGVTGNPQNVNIGTLGAGGSTTVQIGFPQSVGASGSSLIQTITGKYTGGTFGGSAHVTLP